MSIPPTVPRNEVMAQRLDQMANDFQAVQPLVSQERKVFDRDIDAIRAGAAALRALRAMAEAPAAQPTAIDELEKLSEACFQLMEEYDAKKSVASVYRLHVVISARLRVLHQSLPSPPTEATK